MKVSLLFLLALLAVFTSAQQTILGNHYNTSATCEGEMSFSEKVVSGTCNLSTGKVPYTLTVNDSNIVVCVYAMAFPTCQFETPSCSVLAPIGECVNGGVVTSYIYTVESN